MATKKYRKTREEIAMQEIGQTDISKRNQQLLLTFFLLLLVSAMSIQFIFKAQNDAFVEVNTEKEETENVSFFKTITKANDELLQSIQEFETNLEENSIYRKAIIPKVQSLLLNVFKTGNENAWITADNFYYKYSNQYLTQAGFLTEKQLKKRAAEDVQPNPLKAILDFKEKLAKRNIQLMIVPAPPKASFVLKHGDKALNNESYTEFIQKLKQNNIIVCDVFELFEKQQFGAESYLKYDTHWSPQAMESVAKEISKLLDSISIPKGFTEYNTKKIIIQNNGDIADMLNMDNKNHLASQPVEITQVLEDNFLFKPSLQSDVLFLGDSYANIYSLEALNWGTSAGLSEQISKYMQKPVDRIQMNDAGAHATRGALSNELKRGKDRLTGKKIVIWEFAARELSFGDWKLLDMELNSDYISNFFVPETKQSVTVTGIVSETSSVPIPNTVPYKDHVVSVHITNLKDIKTGNSLGESVVYLSSMNDNVWTDAARLRNGQKVTLTLYSWQDYADQFGGLNRSELQDDELSFEDPCWGILKTNNTKE
ncbi:MAG: hypothetical protein AAF611_15110 [Bacteroidota bacterium]